MSFRDTIFKNFSNVDAVHDIIDRYFYRENFTGSKFELVADAAEPNRFTARDIVAVSMLGVSIPPLVSIWLLLEDGGILTGDLLRQVPNDLDIWDATEYLSQDKPLWKLWDLLHGQHGIGDTLCSKLLAAKRPRLVPIMDSVVVNTLGISDDYWRDFRVALSSIDDRSVIEAATAKAPSHISLLRRIDVVLWMLNRKTIV